MGKIFFILWTFFSSHLFAQNVKVVGTYYFVPFYGHLHQNPSDYSQSQTTLACGHPVKLLVNEGAGRGVWDLVETAGKKGYVQSRYLSASRPTCFERKYPEFVHKMELRIEDLYYWGKLYDQYSYAEVKLP